jgi:hypothetical protein
MMNVGNVERTIKQKKTLVKAGEGDTDGVFENRFSSQSVSQSQSLCALGSLYSTSMAYTVCSKSF